MVDVARESWPSEASPARERRANGAAAHRPPRLVSPIVVPVHNEAASLPRLHAELADVARTLNAKHGLACEVVYVDDGSRDDTLAIAHQLPASDALDIQLLSLSRNFGKEAALLAGLDHARLGAVLFIDGDGQHPPSLIETLVRHWLDDGYDVVYTAKAHRANESPVRRFLVKSFYLLLNWGAQTKIPEDAGDFRLLSPRAADALRRLPERNRFFKGLSSWIGFRQIRIDYQPAPRSRRPLHLEPALADRPVDRRLDGVFGGAFARRHSGSDRCWRWPLSFTARRSSMRRSPTARRVPGYPSLFVGVMVLGGVQLIMLGVVGEYIGKILYEIKGRPVYFVAEHAVKPREEQKQPDSRHPHGGGVSHPAAAK